MAWLSFAALGTTVCFLWVLFKAITLTTSSSSSSLTLCSRRPTFFFFAGDIQLGSSLPPCSLCFRTAFPHYRQSQNAVGTFSLALFTSGLPTPTLPVFCSALCWSVFYRGSVDSTLAWNRSGFLAERRNFFKGVLPPFKMLSLHSLVKKRLQESQ